MSAVSNYSTTTEEIIGDYKIEMGFSSCVVRKALGPWPLWNWSWVTFYVGGEDECRRYIEWASRVGAGDQFLIGAASDWMAERIRTPKRLMEADSVLHLPKCMRYDFAKDLSQAPAIADPAPVEAPWEVIVGLIVVIGLLIFGFIYHSV